MLRQKSPKAALTATHLDPVELEYTLEFVPSAMIGVLSYWFQDVNVVPKEVLLALIYRLMNQGALTDLINIPPIGPTVPS